MAISDVGALDGNVTATTVTRSRSPRSSACAPRRPLPGLGKLSRRTGQREQAHEHLTTATTMYREMGMTHWLETAEAAAGESK
jgi:hypothetical protein